MFDVKDAKDIQARAIRGDYDSRKKEMWDAKIFRFLLQKRYKLSAIEARTEDYTQSPVSFENNIRLVLYVALTLPYVNRFRITAIASLVVSLFVVGVIFTQFN